MFLQGLGGSLGLGGTRLGASSALRVEREGLEALSRVGSGQKQVESGFIAFAQNLSSQERGLGEARKGIQDGVALLGVAAEGLTTLLDRVQRLRELVISLGSGVRTAEDRDAIKNEIVESIGAFDAEAQAVQFNNRPLLYLPRRRAMNLNLQVGASRGEQETVALDHVDFRTTRLNRVLTRNLDTVNGRRSALTLIDFAQDKLVDLRQRYANAQLGLETRMGAAFEGQLASADAGSRLRDADLANSAVAFARSQVVSQAGVALLAHNGVRLDGVRSLLGALAG